MQLCETLLNRLTNILRTKRLSKIVKKYLVSLFCTESLAIYVMIGHHEIITSIKSSARQVKRTFFGQGTKTHHEDASRRRSNRIDFLFTLLWYHLSSMLTVIIFRIKQFQCPKLIISGQAIILLKWCLTIFGSQMDLIS